MTGTSRLPVSIRSSTRQLAGSSRNSIIAWNIHLLRNIIFFLYIWSWTRAAWRKVRGRGLLWTISDIFKSIRQAIYTSFLRTPGVRAKVQSQVSTAVLKLEKRLITSHPQVQRQTRLPVEGWNDEKVVDTLEKLLDIDHSRWEDGKVSGTVYHGGSALVDLQTKAFQKFALSNPIHPDVFPGIRKMEAEVVSMTLTMFNGPKAAAGVTTSGGTESILMAVLSARQKAYKERNVSQPEMILPETAHTAFRKAAEYFKIKVHRVSCPAPSYQVAISAVSRLINSNTILLVGSAPNFPHGIIDDISGLSFLAARYAIPLHVDCCLGSFLMPFLNRAGFASEPFDFRLRGVTSISCDTHKYGFAPKGSSVLLYRNESLRAYQYFIDPNWPGGVYGSPSMAGSRPGSIIAGCWASMMNIGESGYISACHSIVGGAKQVEQAIRELPSLSGDLTVLGKPLVSVVAFTSKTIDIYDVADKMGEKGWHLNSLQSPPAVHIAVTLPIVKVIDRFLADLAEVLEGVKEAERVRIAEGRAIKGEAKGDMAALYGVAGSLPTKSVVEQLARGFLDTLYKV